MENEDIQSQRPWGNYQKMHQEDGFWIKRIEVNPGGRLSLQKHKSREEKWFIVKGAGLAVVDNKEIPLKAGSIVEIPLGAVHRIGNTGDRPLIFIEVALGDYLAEDDIIRLEDDYSRS